MATTIDDYVGKVWNMDALELMRQLPDASVDLILTDPPYGHNNNNGDLIHNWEKALARPHVGELNPRPIANDGIEANDLFKAFLIQAKRVLKPGACCCCCCCGGGGPDPQFARWSLWMDEQLEFKQMVVWDKGAMGMGWHYRRSYETVLVAMKPDAACKWYDDSMKIENIIRPGTGANKIIPTADDHPTPKPVGLMEFFIKLHSQEGDVVLDPFSGGGTTLQAARNLNRQFIGCDISPEYVAMANERLRLPFTPRAVTPANDVSDLPLFAALDTR